LGGAWSDGTVFKITPSGTLTTLHNFKGKDGDVPLAALTQYTNGNLYGTTEAGGERRWHGLQNHSKRQVDDAL
jgi:uncharacterized repeat protein (TIGR03803 family)